MKKLMIAAAASIAAVSAFAAVESPNIVGYLQQDLTPGVKTVNGTPFVVIGGEGTSFKLTDLVPMNGSSVAADGTIELSWYDYAKGGFRFVRWYDDLYDTNDQELGRAGWAEDQDNQYPPSDEASIEFEAGRGFFVAPNSSVASPWVAFPNPFYKE